MSATKEKQHICFPSPRQAPKCQLSLGHCQGHGGWLPATRQGSEECRWTGLSAPRCGLCLPTWGDMLLVMPSRNIAWERLPGGQGLAPALSRTPASAALPQHDEPGAPWLQGGSRARSLSRVPSVRSSAVACRHPRAAGWETGARRAGCCWVSACGLPSPRIPSGSLLGRGR